MTKKFRNILKLFALGTIFVLDSCQKDNYDDAIYKKTNIITMRQVSLKDNKLKSNFKLMSAVNTIKQKNQLVQNPTSRMVYDSINNFYFDDEKGMLIEKNGKDAYTFLIKRISGTETKLENIVFNKNELNEYDTYIVKYNFTEEQLKLMSNQDILLNSQTDTDYTQIAGRMNLDCVTLIVSACSGDPYDCHGSECGFIEEEFCDGGGGSLGNDGGSIGVLTTPSGGGLQAPENPCNRLKDLFSPTKGDVKTLAEDLFTTIPQVQGENGSSLNAASNGYHSNVTLNQNTTTTSSGNYSVQVPAGNNIYGGIHSHPLDAYPMFTFSDVLTLNTISIHADHHNRKKAVFMLACIDDSGNNQLYAIVLDPVAMVTLEDLYQRPEYLGCTPEDVDEIKELELEKKCKKEYNLPGIPNYERAFLQQMFGLNVKLYKANPALTDWEQLKINSLTGNVSNIPCN